MGRLGCGVERKRRGRRRQTSKALEHISRGTGQQDKERKPSFLRLESNVALSTYLLVCQLCMDHLSIYLPAYLPIYHQPPSSLCSLTVSLSFCVILSPYRVQPWFQIFFCNWAPWFKDGSACLGERFPFVFYVVTVLSSRAFLLLFPR